MRLRYAEIRALVGGVTAIPGHTQQKDLDEASLVRNVDRRIFGDHVGSSMIDLPSKTGRDREQLSNGSGATGGISTAPWCAGIRAIVIGSPHGYPARWLGWFELGEECSQRASIVACRSAHIARLLAMGPSCTPRVRACGFCDARQPDEE
jgi:hypothetical protein